jgi:SAM-dependent methyltransferase
MDRVAKLLSTSQRSSRIIEVGPCHAPIAPKAAGWNSFVIDHATQPELRAKFRGMGVNVEGIEPVDFVWTAGGMDAAVPAAFHGTFDTVIASHAIEHMPDFIGFFNAAAKLLKPTGTVALAVPDKRYCFDFFRPVSMAGEVIEAHLLRLSRHARRTAFNHAAHIVSGDSKVAWGQHPVTQFEFLNPLKAATRALAKWTDDPDEPYKDYHAWQYTPASFELLILELGLVGTLDWHVVTVFPTEGSEFIALLQPGLAPFVAPETSDEERMALLRRMLVETREQLDCVLGPSSPGLAGEAALPAIPAMLEAQQRIEAALPAIPAMLETQTGQLQRIETGLPGIRAGLEAQNRQLRELAAALAPNAALLAQLERLAQLAQRSGGDPAVTGQINAGLAEITNRLRAQDTTLHEIAEVAFWFRRALRPVRWSWRALLPVRRLFRRAPQQPG